MSILRNLVTKASSMLQPFATSSFSPPRNWPIDWWSRGFRLPGQGAIPAVETCVSAISQTIAALPVYHYRETGDGGFEPIKNSRIRKILRKPNSYQTRADFVLNLLRSELLEGNGYAVGVPNEDGDIESLHLVPPKGADPLIADDGSIFYGIQMGSQLMNMAGIDRLIVPQRYMLHIRMQTPRHPLIGESPVVAAQLAVQSAEAIQEHLASFFGNMSRPSGYLKVPGALKAENAEKLREEWETSFRAGSAGRVAVLQGGLDWVPLTMSAVDSQMIEAYKMTVADVARVYRVPLSIAGESGSATFSTTEALIRFWLNTGLGFIIEHLELALDALFDLPDDEFIAFDLDYLLRADFAARVDALCKGITGGLFAPNEARNKEGLKSVPYGDEPRMQAQVVPLSAASRIPATAPTPPSTRLLPAPEEVSAEELQDTFTKFLETLDHA